MAVPMAGSRVFAKTTRPATAPARDFTDLGQLRVYESLCNLQLRFGPRAGIGGCSESSSHPDGASVAEIADIMRKKAEAPALASDH